MSDRELLEMAAKAAGLWVKPPRGCEIAEHLPVVFYHEGKPWNPLADDGDALRLFNALPWMCIETSDVAVTVRERGNHDEPSRVYLMWTEWLDNHNGDIATATRRAIVRAAAEIGRTM